MPTWRFTTAQDDSRFTDMLTQVKVFIDASLIEEKKRRNLDMGRLMGMNTFISISGTPPIEDLFYLHTDNNIKTLDFSGFFPTTYTTGTNNTLIKTFTTNFLPFSFDQTLSGTWQVQYFGQIQLPDFGNLYFLNFEFYKVDGSDVETLLFQIRGQIEQFPIQGRVLTVDVEASGDVLSTDNLRIKVFSDKQVI